VAPSHEVPPAGSSQAAIEIASAPGSWQSRHRADYSQQARRQTEDRAIAYVRVWRGGKRVRTLPKPGRTVVYSASADGVGAVGAFGDPMSARS